MSGQSQTQSAAERAQNTLALAISSRALFDLDESHQLYEAEGLDAYTRYQMQHENDPLKPGIAFALVKKLLALNERLQRDAARAHLSIEVLLLSRNSGDSGLRIFNSIEHYGLNIVRAAFTNGAPPHRYIEAFGADLFLSAHGSDARAALNAGFAAARILPGLPQESDNPQLRIAFDGDAVLFSDEAERVSREMGLNQFHASERALAQTPLSGGPFKGVLQALQRIQAAFPAGESPIRTALVTARSAPAHKRVILTLRDWDIRIDEALFLGGRDKAPFLQAFGADIFFDDQSKYVTSAASQNILSGHVEHGVANPVSDASATAHK
jgi:5'-nucleotidase